MHAILICYCYFFVHTILICYCYFDMLLLFLHACNFDMLLLFPSIWTFSNDLLAIFMFWFYPAFCSLGVNICLVLSAFTSRPNSSPATDNFCFSYSMTIFHNLEFWLWSKNLANCASNVTVVCKSCYPFKLTSDPNLWHLMNCSVKLTFSKWPLNVYSN
jgi:hypothetical protein